jgi:subtilase family serine protease
MTRQLLAGSLFAAAALATGGYANAGTAPSPVAAAQPVSFSVYLPLRNTAAMKTLLTAQQTKGSPSYHQWLKPSDVAAQFGPTAATIAQAKAALTAAGLKVTATHLRSLTVTGTAGAVNKAFQVSLKSIPTSEGGTRVISQTKVIVPASLSQLGATVPTFAMIPEHRPAGRVLAAAPDNRNGPAGGYNYNDLKQAYDYPSYAALDGTGVNVAIVMESAARNEDIAAMFNHESFTATTGKAPPTYNYVPIDGGGSYGGIDDGGTDEVELDTQMVLGGAPGATVTQLSIPDLSDNSILDAYGAVIDSGAYDIVTSSFGGCELFYTAPYNNGYDFTYILGIYDEILEIGNLEGVTWFASSGDSAGLSCPSLSIIPYFVGVNSGAAVKFIKGIETPAADPNVTAVGGGNLITSYIPGSLQSTYVGEQGFGDPEIPYDDYGVGVNITGGYWGATGGLSQVFAQPAYQTLVNTKSTARTTPDIGMLVGGCPGGISQLPCGPDRAYVIVTIGAPAGTTGVGYRYGFIGTSVSSPELAGALAVVEQGLGGRLGNINPYLYSQSAAQIAAGAASAPAASQFYHMNTPGFDGAYTSSAAGGYNYIYGNGSPDVRNLFALTSLPAAGLPRTPSNP